MKVRALLAAGVLVVAAPTAASAVWGGEPDGDGHPNVGAFFFDFDDSGTISGDDLICTGSYVGTHFDHDVFLTAGHCLPPPEEGIPPEALSVSFDPDVSDGVASLIVVEEFHVMPGIGHDRGDLKDLGVLLMPPGSVDAAFDSPRRSSCRPKAISTT